MLLGLCVTAPIVQAQDAVTIRAEADRTSVTLDDQIVLVVTIEGRLRSVEEPEKPVLDDFDLYPRGRTQSMQIVNGQVSGSNAFTYVLVPKREGKFTIGPFTARIGGKTLRTEPITITVGGGPGVRGAPAPATGEPAEREDRNVFVLARVDKQHAFVNEQILFTFYLYRAVQLSNMNYSAPDFRGFWVENLKDSERQSYKVLNGRRYLVTEASKALFPTTSGTLTIAPATLQVVELTNPFGFSLFDRGVERVLRTKGIDVQVAALPAAGRPPIFDGAVGEGLQLDVRCDRTTVEEGEPITMTIAVEGSGNVKTFSKPRLPDLPHFKTYDAESKTEATAVDRVYGKRTYEVVLVPRNQGEYTIGRVRMAYFDTREGRYRLLESNPITVTAQRSTNPSQTAESNVPVLQQEVQVTGRDLAHIHPDLRVADDLRPLYTRGIGMLAPLPLLAMAAVAMRQRRRNLLASDVALARSTRARKLARKHLAAAQKHLASRAGEAFYAEVSRALLHYVGDKLNVSAIGSTHGALREQVRAAGAPEMLCDRFIAMLERCDAARFAPGSMGGERLREVLSEAEGLIVDLDGVLARRRGRTAVATPFATLLLASALAAAPGVGAQALERTTNEFTSPLELLRRGHAAYEAGNFVEAVNAYERAAGAGVRTGALYYNLGNAYFKSEQLGKAIASYRRAERLAPRDRELQANLAHVLARREDKAMQTPAMPLIAVGQAFLRRMSLNEWILVCAALYVLASATVILTTLRGGRGWLRVVHKIAIAAGITAILVTAVKVRTEGVDRGVVGVPRLPVTSGPGATYTTEFSLHEGADVRIESRRDDWLRISVNRTLRGWVPASGILTI